MEKTAKKFHTFGEAEETDRDFYKELIGNDTSGRYHSVQLVLHHDGSVIWRDLTRHPLSQRTAPHSRAG